MSNQKGFTVVEIILAAALFVIFAVGVMTAILQGLDINRLGEEQTTANQYATEGIEAVRSIKNQNFTNLANSVGVGVGRSGGVWAFSGVNNQFGPSNKYTRVLTVSDVQRDGGGNIVASGGTVDPSTKKITSTVSWNVSPTRPNSVALSTYLTNWKAKKGGMLVYGNGGTTTDAMSYQIYNGDGTWGTAATMADVDAGSANRAVRAINVYSSSTRNEKIAVSRHFDGTVQYIYAQVYNGTGWGNIQLLHSWTANTFLGVRNFDGTYLNDGTFMVVYSDNTNVPKMRTWNGLVWSAESSLTSLGAAGEIPAYIRIATRDATNEVMAAFFTQALDTITEYWSGSAWSAITSHATNAFNANNQEMDFAWSPNTPTIGALVYLNANNNRAPRGKLFQADGAGGGTWGAQSNGANAAQNIRSLMVAARSNANEFQTCFKDQQAAPDITCRKETFSGTTATWTTPTNPILTASSVSDTNLSFGLGFESVSGDPAVNVYSVNTSTPTYRKYTAATTTWDAAATIVTALGGVLNSVRVIPQPGVDDMMILLGGANLTVYSIMWDGTSNAMFSSPTGKALLSHGTNGSATTDSWYDFAWDNL